MAKATIASSVNEVKTSSNVRIRLATLDDLKSVQLCAQAAYAKYIERMNCEPAPMLADFASQISSGYIFVALNDSVFAGYVSFYPVGECLHLESVALLPDQMSKGIGRGLVEFVENAARDQGITSVKLYTNAAMTENLSLYPTLGYVEIGRKQQAGYYRVFYQKFV